MKRKSANTASSIMTTEIRQKKVELYLGGSNMTQVIQTITTATIGTAIGMTVMRLIDKKKLNSKDEMIIAQQQQIEQQRKMNDLLQQNIMMNDHEIAYLKAKMEELEKNQKKGGSK